MMMIKIRLMIWPNRIENSSKHVSNFPPLLQSTRKPLNCFFFSSPVPIRSCIFLTPTLYNGISCMEMSLPTNIYIRDHLFTICSNIIRDFKCIWTYHNIIVNQGNHVSTDIVLSNVSLIGWSEMNNRLRHSAVSALTEVRTPGERVCLASVSPPMTTCSNGPKEVEELNNRKKHALLQPRNEIWF